MQMVLGTPVTASLNPEAETCCFRGFSHRQKRDKPDHVEKRKRQLQTGKVFKIPAERCLNFILNWMMMGVGDREMMMRLMTA